MKNLYELFQHLLELSKDPVRYEKYLEWRKPGKQFDEMMTAGNPKRGESTSDESRDIFINEDASHTSIQTKLATRTTHNTNHYRCEMCKLFSQGRPNKSVEPDTLSCNYNADQHIVSDPIRHDKSSNLTARRILQGNGFTESTSKRNSKSLLTEVRRPSYPETATELLSLLKEMDVLI